MEISRQVRASGKVNPDPIAFVREMAKSYRPRLAVPEGGSREDYLAWTQQVRQKVHEVLGLDFMLPAPPEIGDYAETVEDGIKRERFFLQTEPGYWAPVIVNIPEGRGPFPLVLCLHGHCTNGKDGVSGLIADIPGYDKKALQEESEHYNDHYAIDLTRRGFLTVALDNRDFNQAICPEPYQGNEFGWHLADIAWQAAFGRSYVGCAVWDALKVFDYALRRHDVDPARAGCIGFSLGGLLTTYVTVLEPRIKAAVISGYFINFLRRISVAKGADCLCNYIPNLYVWFDVPDVTAAIAPRPLLCNNEIGRGGEGLEHLQEAFARVQRVYDALGVSDRCELYTFAAPYHVFSGERAYPWLARWL